MSIFEKVTLEWKNKKFVIEPENVLKAIAIIEEHFTVNELIQDMAAERIKVSRLCSCMGDVLRFAGSDVTDEELYAGMYGGGDGQAKVVATIQTLILMVIPPEQLKAVETAPGKSTTTTRTRRTTTKKRSSSSRSTKR